MKSFVLEIKAMQFASVSSVRAAQHCQNWSIELPNRMVSWVRKDPQG